MSPADPSREQLIEELSDLRWRYEELLNDLPDALFEWDITGEPRLTYMNRMAFILTGYTDQDYERGIPVGDFFRR
jgi:PAS domain-containing protein